MEPRQPPVEIEYEYTVTAVFASTLLRSLLLLRLRSPAFLASAAVWVVFEIVVVATWRLSPPLGTIAALVPVLALALQHGLPFLRARQVYRAMAERGETYGLGFGETRLAFRGSHSVSEADYSQLRGITVRHGVMAITYTGGYNNYFPADLVPASRIAEIEARIARAQAG